ncbi:MAG: DEAD/DEAH box helicase [Candidatus Margulisiibacteriota bacterium]
MSIQRIQFIFEFFFGRSGKLFIPVEAVWKDKPLNLSLSSLMTFLHQNETALHPKDADFCFSLAKFLKKVQWDERYILAVATDSEMALFFKRAKELGITLKWKRHNLVQPLRTHPPLPLEVIISQRGKNLICSMSHIDRFRQDPLSWLTFKFERDLFCFCQGALIHNPPSALENFLMRFMDKDIIKYEQEAAIQFIQSIYQPNKKNLKWVLEAKISSILPQETPPVPLMKVEMAGTIMQPTLYYQYGRAVIGSDYNQPWVEDLGKRHERMTDLEAIYQQDLIALFNENELPFLLQSPGDMARFLDEVVPVLKERGWIIQINAPELVVLDEPGSLEFKIDSSEKNWFFFEPNCTIEGETFSLQEIARLMIQNQGYIETKKGYVRLTQSSQDQLKTLQAFGALKTGKSFSKAEILPLLASTQAKTENKDLQELIEGLKHGKNQYLPAKAFKGELRDYQQFGVNWIGFLHNAGFGGILADDMGLGKTVQVLAFISRIQGKGPVLVVGPTNVLYNWKKESQHFLPNQKCVIYSGSNRSSLVKSFNTADIVVTSFGILKNDLELFSAIPWQAMIIDEAQAIKNPDTHVSKAVKAVPAPFKLVMTGTPIENHLQDIWNLFDTVMPGYLGTRSAFDVMVKQEQLDQLKLKIKPFILRREKREVLDSLPEKTEIIVSCPLTKSQEMLYQTVLDAVRKGIQNGKGQRERLHVLTSLLKLRQVCIHPGLLTEFQNQFTESGKFDTATETILELLDEGHKIVLFSQFTKMLDILADWAKKNSVRYERIDGSVTGKNRMDAVDRFQNTEDPTLFMISLKAGGMGINLTSADYVIHLDPWWNPAVEAQATDRVHRIGQMNKVFVYKFISEGTIEEKIQELQESKRQLLGELVDVDGLNEKTINFEDLKALLF